MSQIFTVDGAPGSRHQAERYRAYFRSIAEPLSSGPEQTDGCRNYPVGVRHRLRSEIGEGMIDVLESASNLRIVRYDVAFRDRHHLEYVFPSDRFELEVCFGGCMEISERRAGEGTLTQGRVSLSPCRKTRGTVVFPAGERYRAVSISGSYPALGPYLGTVGPESFRNELERARNRPGGADGSYLGSGGSDPEIPRLAGQLYSCIPQIAADPHRAGPGRVLGLEALISACCARLADGEEGRQCGDPVASAARFAEHEVAAVRRIPDLLWRRRHALPTVAELAGSLSMSPGRLSEVHRFVFGATVMEHHRRRCTDEACRLLTTTSWTVEHVAHECGYASASNFIFAFRRRLGCTPGQYRREQLPG